MTDSPKDVKNIKNKLIRANFTGVENLGLTSTKLQPYYKEIIEIREIKPISHKERMKMLKKEINTIYSQVTGDSEELDSYDGTMDGGSVIESDDDISSDSSSDDSSPDSEYESDQSIVYGSGYDSYGEEEEGEDEEEEEDEDEEEEEVEDELIKGGSSEESADLIDILVQKRLALKGVMFLHKYEKKFASYIKKQGQNDGENYLNTLNIANIYLSKFGFHMHTTNIHMFNLIWESLTTLTTPLKRKLSTLYIVMYMANNNEKYKFFVREFETQLPNDKVMFYVLGVLFCYLKNRTHPIWISPKTDDEVKEMFGDKNKWKTVDWSYNYINQVFWTVSNKGREKKRNFLKLYLKYGFSVIALIVSNNLNTYIEGGKDLLEFYFNGEFEYDKNSLKDLNEKNANEDLFSKLFLIFASLDFTQKNSLNMPKGLVNHFTKTPSFISWKPVRKMPILKYFRKLKFGSNKKRNNFTSYLKAKKELLFDEQVNDIICSIILGPEKLDKYYNLKGGGIPMKKDRKKQNEELMKLTKTLDTLINDIKQGDLKKVVSKMTKKEKIKILRSMNIKSELIGFNNNKIISLKDIYNLGNIYLTRFLLQLLMSHPSTQLIFDTQIINVRENGFTKYNFENDESLDENLAIQNFAGKFMDKNGTLFLFFCCNRDQDGKGLNKYQKSLHLFKTLKKNVSLKNYFHEPNIHLAVKIVTTQKSTSSMKNKIDSFPLQVIQIKNPYIFNTGSWLNPGLQMFFRSSNSREHIKTEKEVLRLQTTISRKEYSKNKKIMKYQKKLDKLQDKSKILLGKIKAAKNAGKTLQMNKLQKDHRNLKRQIKKLKKKMKEEEKEMTEEIRELQDLKLKSQDRLTRFNRPIGESEFIRDVEVASDVAADVAADVASGVTMSKNKERKKNPDSQAEEAGKIQSNNPIYGIANGGNTCFFASALQVLFSLSESRFGKMLEDSIAASTDVKEQCKDILSVIQKIHNITMRDGENKVVQIGDYFPDIRQISNARTLNWGWVNGWGRQQDAGEVITTLVSECMEDSFKQPVIKYSTYQHKNGSLKRLNNISVDGQPWSEAPVIQLDGNDFDGFESITCDDLLRIPVPQDVDEKKSFYRKFLDAIEDYKKYSNPNSNKGKLKIKTKDQVFSIPGISWMVLSELVSLYNRYNKLDSLLNETDKEIFDILFRDLNIDIINDMRVKLQIAYRAGLDKLINRKMSTQELEYDDGVKKFYVKSDISKKAIEVTIIKKELEKLVHEDGNEEVKNILKKIPNFDIILKNPSLVNLLKRITYSPEESKLFDTPYLFILPQLIEWGSSAHKKTDMVGKFQYPVNIEDTFNYNGKNYQLIGVVYHSGYAGGGHYVAEVLREGKLYLCNDSSTQNITHWNTYDGTNVVPSVFLFQEVVDMTERVVGGRKTKKRVKKKRNRTKKKRAKK